MTDVRDDHLDALLDAADEGVDCDGLVVERRADGYAVETPDASEAGLGREAARDALADRPRLVSNWFYWARTVGRSNEPRYDFLRWVERADERTVAERYDALADGVEREWGELLVTACLGDGGERRYDLRHADDAGTPVEALDDRADPLDLREVVTFDERGRYRPLKTAPTLRGGWVCPDFGGHDLVEAVDVVYPATVANWHREREGDLDVDHWTETMQRQTGMYGVIETWDRQEGHEHVNWVAEACCDDSQCLKRREWEYGADEPLDVDGGDGVFPCREPCSLVVAAARRWTKLEGERSRTYELELTPSEKEQVEAIIDAVADGRTDEIREADVSDPANRYRARFLRAKRFDEAGNLSGTPTDPEASEAGEATEADD